MWGLIVDGRHALGCAVDVSCCLRGSPRRERKINALMFLCVCLRAHAGRGNCVSLRLLLAAPFAEDKSDSPECRFVFPPGSGWLVLGDVFVRAVRHRTSEKARGLSFWGRVLIHHPPSGRNSQSPNTTRTRHEPDTLASCLRVISGQICCIVNSIT